MNYGGSYGRFVWDELLSPDCHPGRNPTRVRDNIIAVQALLLYTPARTI
jgi:hypothetical protein